MAGAGNSTTSPAQARRAATHIVRVLREGGFTAYFAGGCVRDELLGLHPSDYDVATDARPEQIKKLFPRTAAVGAAFGVMLVHVDEGQLPKPVRTGETPVPRLEMGGGGVTVEVATFRSDGTYTDARRPDSVLFSTDKEDAARRDFTINALFLDPLDEGRRDVPEGGRVIDYVGGVADLGHKLVRAVGDADARLAEDHLRALRAVRFAARLGFEIDGGTADAIRRHAAELRGVSRERIGDELRRMMASPTRAEAVEWLKRLNLEQPAFNLAEMREATAAGERLAGLDRAYEGLAGLETLGYATGSAVPFAVCLAAWWLDRQSGEKSKSIDEAAIRGVVARLRAGLCLSNAETEELSRVLEIYAAIVGDGGDGWAAMRVCRQRRTASRAGFVGACVLIWAEDRGLAAGVVGRAVELAADEIGLSPAPLLLGDGLIEMGLKPGPAFRRILDEVYDAQLEGKVATPEEARELAGRLSV